MLTNGLRGMSGLRLSEFALQPDIRPRVLNIGRQLCCVVFGKEYYSMAALDGFSSKNQPWTLPSTFILSPQFLGHSKIFPTTPFQPDHSILEATQRALEG